MREIITNVYIWVRTSQLLCSFLYSLLMSMNTGAHPATHSHQSHTWRGRWLLGQQVRLWGQHVTEASDKPRDCDVITQASFVVTLSLTYACTNNRTRSRFMAPTETRAHSCAHTQIHKHSAPRAYRKRPNDLGF